MSKNQILFSVADETEEGLAYGVLIPVEVRRKVSGEVTVSCYPQVEAEVRAILANAADPLSADTIRALIDACAPFAATYATEPEPYDPDFYYHVYEMDAPQMPCMAADVEMRPLAEEDFSTYPNHTDFTPDFAEQRMVGILCDGVICAVAAENPYAPEGTAEVQVCTAPAYRGRGFAAACVSALARLLFSNGVSYICYHCPRTNRASIHVAEVAGFTLGAEYYAVLCYTE